MDYFAKHTKFHIKEDKGENEKLIIEEDENEGSKKKFIMKGYRHSPFNMHISSFEITAKNPCFSFSHSSFSAIKDHCRDLDHKGTTIDKIYIHYWILNEWINEKYRSKNML